MDRTVVLITGCSSGIGLHLALRLAADPSRSFTVYATLRDLSTQGPLWEAAGSQGCPPGSLKTLQLDVQDADSVAAARARVTEGRVDVLVCNAGRGLHGPIEVLPAEAVGSVLDVNLVGMVQMLQAFLPDMKRRRSGRILVTGSMGGLMGLPFNAVYCASKFAIEGLCESLAVQLPPFGIHVSLIECGPVRTAFQAKVQDGLGAVLGGADAQTRDLFSRYQRHFEQVFREAAQDPEEVTEVFLTALRAPQPALRYFASERILPLARLRLADPSGCSYVAAMHRTVFGDQPAQGPEGAPAKPGAGQPGGPESGAPPAAPK
ncbi:17-beta-hydroxysteroid dehydrogenase type 1 [Pipistrellus kuhlii]|uniref:Hydroxysteroid 17-beta dehydrogenase 1 n=1 Tax=Pipistrellus kuhlii TaxID=59472 RepID=A0A7J7U819_PIPKU|nr:17-beta-hydroxysteroid dehydrogenase type 1 [Pipistrellus kuhlii]KAF6309010.1 hydroxysteroid 17-beta dehydrogenase 1 [Pipistrellus kuhlii]